MSGKPDSGCNALWQTVKNKGKKMGHSVNLPEVVVSMTSHLLGENVYLQVILGGFIEQIVFIFKKKKKRKCTRHSCTQKILDLIWSYFLANEIFIAFVCVILKPCRASRAAPACTSLSNSTKAMSWRPGTRRTSLKPGNLNATLRLDSVSTNKKLQWTLKQLLTGWTAWTAWARLSLLGDWWGRECDWGDFLKPVKIKAKLIQNTKQSCNARCIDFVFPMTTHLRHLPWHHGTRRHLTRRHPRGRHHTRWGHIRWLTWHVHHTRGLAHRRDSLREGHQKCLASILLLTMRPLCSCQHSFKTTHIQHNVYSSTYSHSTRDPSNHGCGLWILLAPWGVRGLNLLLLLFTVPFHISSLHFGYNVRVLLSILDTL